MSSYRYNLREAGPAPLGMVVLQSDETIEQDMRRLLGDNAPYVTRVPSGLEVTSQSLQQMAAHLTRAAGLFPATMNFSAIGYGCTSGAAQIGSEKIARLIAQGAQTATVTDPVRALIAACSALKIKRLAFLSPYIRDVSEHLRMVLARAGIQTPVFGSFEEANEAKVVRISGDSILDAGVDLCAGQDIDGLFLSCTNLRTLEVIAPLEQRLRLPVLSSNLVLGWHMAHLAGVAFSPMGRLR